MKRYKRKLKIERQEYADWQERVGTVSKIHKEFTPLIPKPVFRRDEGESYPSHETTLGIVAKDKPKYTGEMLEREKKAQEEIERKKLCVAVPYNKGPIMYVAGYNPKDFGKK